MGNNFEEVFSYRPKLPEGNITATGSGADQEGARQPADLITSKRQQAGKLLPIEEGRQTA